MEKTSGVVLCIENDATDELLERLEEQIRELTRLHEKRSNFLSTVAYDLRAPLASIKGYLYLLRGDIMDDEQRELCLERIAGEVDTVIDLVSDILFLQEMSMIFQGVGPVSLGKIASKVVNKVGPMAREMGLPLRAEIPGHLSPVLGVSDLLEKVFDHLLDNALKFSSIKGTGGEIVVRLRERGNSVEVAISDKGIGIPPGKLDRIFGRFYRVERSELPFEGRGLGLAVAKQIIEEHGGRIWAESVLNVGSVFYFSLPKMDQDVTD
jgi:signal transduction histidine kinase